jgi:hypothetical protein
LSSATHQQLAIEALQAQQDTVDYLGTHDAWMSFHGSVHDVKVLDDRFKGIDGLSVLLAVMIRATHRAAVFAIAPEMRQAVDDAAATMPEDERVLEDDLLSPEGILYLGDNPLELPSSYSDATALVDTLMWMPSDEGFHLVLLGSSWRNRNYIGDYEKRRAGLPRIISVAHVNQVFGRPVRRWVGTDGIPIEADIDSAGIVWLCAMRIMQQSYSETVSASPPRGISRRLERAGKTNSINVIQFRRRRTITASTGRHLETRHIRRAHWRRHQRYKNNQGDWAEKSVFIPTSVVGPDDAPWAMRPTVGVLSR